MEETKKITFWGVELNDEELKNHRLSYRTVAKQFNAILCNNIFEVDPYLFDSLESGELYRYYVEGEEATREEYEQAEEEGKSTGEELEDIFQYYIVDDNALWYLKRMNEIVFYSEKLDCYIWGVTHFGTSWDYVMTSLRLNKDFTSLED